MQTASLPGTRASSKADTLLYNPLDFVVVRAPLLPVESYCSLSDEDDLLSRFVDPHIQRALAVGSSSLLATLERFKHKGLNPRDTELMRAKLLRYLIRMSTRPTPFGLFAGVTLASWGAVTDLSVKSTCAATRTRPDMAWLIAFVASIEAIPPYGSASAIARIRWRLLRPAELLSPNAQQRAKMVPALRCQCV